ncbi:MAG: GGDEF domain-containing protein [Gammaproteobacteria bacterium]
MNYAQTRDSTVHYLRQALPLMAKQPAAFNPCTYAVWYEHVAGVNEALSAALQSRLDAGFPLSDDEVAVLYQSYIAVRESRASERVTHLLNSVLQEVMASARSAGADLSRFTTNLELRTKELEGPLEQMAIQALVSGLLGDTRQMRVSTGALAERMDANAREVTDLQERLAEARTQALTDSLTGLRNRRGFDHDAGVLQKQYGTLATCALLFIDVDRFKEVNETYGHVLGDKVLGAVGEVIRSSIKGRDVAARMGGEEFAVLLPQTTLSGAQALAEQLRQAIAKGRVRRPEGEPIGNVTISIGVAHCKPNETLESLLTRADAAMFAAKEAGRNLVRTATSE